MSRDRTSRRRFVRIAGATSVAAAVGLAGCSTPGGGEGDDESGETGGGGGGGENGEGGEGGEEDDSLTGPSADQ
ncbi:hypothetical protein [Haloprofundus salinisoli]|uniref:hypothetical protein n=1 Tax=Haloprofundus salinisoli TaxID=2876193 RepID=UPI001CC9C8C2|nr:hypothetical protein [Haloprofundus salinisoli]